MTRSRVAIAFLLAASGGIVSAELPPQIQNVKDLNELVAFIKKHRRVVSTTSILPLSERDNERRQ